MYSLNVPVPGRVARIAADLAPALAGFERVRHDHTLVVKRLGSPDPHEFSRIQAQVREALAGFPPFEARVSGIGVFEQPAAGPAPVVYLAVESPGIRRAHERLVGVFPPAEGVEGDEYVPHVTLARGGNAETARRLAEQEIEPVDWSVEELMFWDAGHGGRAGQIRLPV